MGSGGRHDREHDDVAAAGTRLALTQREQDVLTLVTQRLTSVEVGARLYVTSLTVESHVGNAMRKLGAANRSDGVGDCAYRGLIASDDL